jgi:hypothetical protein
VRVEAATVLLSAEAAGETETAVVAEVDVAMEVISDLPISVSRAGVANVEDSVGTVELPAEEVSTRFTSCRASRLVPAVVTLAMLPEAAPWLLRIWKV